MFSFSRIKKLPLAGGFFILFVFIALLVGPFGMPSSHDFQRVGQMGVLTLMSMTCLVGVEARKRSVFAGIVLSVLAIILALLSPQWRWGLMESTHLSLLVVSGTLLVSVCRKLNGRWLLELVLISTGLYVFACGVRWAALVFEGFDFLPQEFFPGFINQRFFGHWVTLTWPLLVLISMSPWSGPRKSFAASVIAALLWCLVIASGTRGSCAAAVVMLLGAVFCGAIGQRFALKSALIILAGLALYLALFQWLPGSSFGALARLNEGANLSRRDELWAVAWEGIRQHPWLGVGPMMYAANHNGVASHPHSIVFQLAYEWGVPLMLVGIVITANFVWRQFMCCRREGCVLRIALLMCISGGLVQSLVDGLLVMPHSQMCFVLLCAWILALDPVPASRPIEGWMMSAWPVVRYIPLVAAVLMWSAAWPELSRLGAWEDEILLQTGAGYFQPRFWLQGVVSSAP